ncbi:MAG: hypothetical protein KME50_32875 [Nostoc desertorum CM1-VF14]|jgi:flavorubredoxin|nr:hypothetical protein [Nostoc desertorum CM1-VF14]
MRFDAQPAVNFNKCTDYGNTEKMAEAIASGVTSVLGTEVQVKFAEDVTEDDVIASDAVIVGFPVHLQRSQSFRVLNLRSVQFKRCFKKRYQWSTVKQPK